MDKNLTEDWIMHSGKPSVRSRFVRQVVRSVMGIANSKNLEQTRAMWEAQAKKVQIPKEFEVRSVNVGGVSCEWITHKSKDSKKTIIYLHGGGYVLGSIVTARIFALKLSSYTGEKVLSVGYRLAPEHTFPAALEDSLTVYRELQQQGMNSEDLILAGDSAGGGLCLATVLALKDEGEPLPGGIVCISPWTDLAATGESNEANKKVDPIFGRGSGVIKAEDYAGGESLSNPLISPLYGDYTGFPPILIHVGSDEVILDDSLGVAEKAREAGAQVSLKIWKGMWHVFTNQDKVVPEARQSFREIAEFINNLKGSI